jgi:hypothetical protein
MRHCSASQLEQNASRVVASANCRQLALSAWRVLVPDPLLGLASLTLTGHFHSVRRRRTVGATKPYLSKLHQLALFGILPESYALQVNFRVFFYRKSILPSTKYDSLFFLDLSVISRFIDNAIRLSISVLICLESSSFCRLPVIAQAKISAPSWQRKTP